VLQSGKGERGLRLEAEGEILNIKVQMTNEKGERLRLRLRLRLRRNEK
jgi:hypothetical protein